MCLDSRYSWMAEFLGCKGAGGGMGGHKTKQKFSLMPAEVGLWGESRVMTSVLHIVISRYLLYTELQQSSS